MLSIGLLVAPPPANAAPAAELIIIDNIKVGSPVMSTKDSCNGVVHHQSPVVPMTIKATFIMSSGDPTGPYATGEWSGGYGSWDNHFATAVAHNHTQFFHVLLRSGNLSGYAGPGYYTVTATVQDVGVGPAITSKSKRVYLPAPSPTIATVKCQLTQSSAGAYLLDELKSAAVDQVKDLALTSLCEVCSVVKGYVDQVNGYADMLHHAIYDSIEKDPPDPDYQQIAKPDPPPVLPASGGTPKQQATLAALETQLADDVGIARAISTTLDRVWGADNAAGQYWYRRQMSALNSLAAAAAGGLSKLPPLYTALKTALSPGLPSFTVDGSDVNAALSAMQNGLAPDGAT
ncbi:MAG: hypothetical protein ACRDQ1_14375, partial [Sciscionella sp.]